MPIASTVTLRRISTILLAVCACLAAPAAALAGGDAVLRDCNDNGKLDKKYKQSEYRDAIENIPTDLDEYTDCRDVIRRAQLGLGGSGGGTNAGSGPGSTGGGGTGSTGGGDANATEALQNASPQERAALEAKAAAGNTAIRVGGELLQPGKLQFSGVSSSTSLPTPLIIMLALLAAAALATGGFVVRNRVLRR